MGSQKYEGPRRVATLRRPITTVLNGRPNLTTKAVNSVNQSCGHSRAIVRSVSAPGGAAGYLCFACFAHLRAVEVRIIEVDRVRRELANLFNSWPGGINLRAFTLAAIGEGRAAR